MEKILVYFIHESLFISKVNILSSHYIEIEGIFPVKDVRGNYFNEDVNFYSESALAFLKTISVHVLRAHYNLVQKPISEVRSIVEKYLLPYENEWPLEVLRNMVEDHYSAQPCFFSTDLLHCFANNHIRYGGNKRLSFELKNEIKDVEKRLELYIQVILAMEVDDVLFYHYRKDDDGDSLHDRKLVLKSDSLTSELLLQELCIMLFSLDKDSLDYERFFTERFNNFTDKQRLNLFVSAEKLGLQIYNRQLSAWWHSRY